MIPQRQGRAVNEFVSSERASRERFDPLADFAYEPDLPAKDPREIIGDERAPTVVDHAHNGKDAPKVSLEDLAGLFQVVSSVPTIVPRNVWESVKIYSNAGTRRLYIYVTDSSGAGAWRYTALT